MNMISDKVFKSGLSKFFKGCLPQNLLSPLLNTLSDIIGSVGMGVNVMSLTNFHNSTNALCLILP